jgi:hypothetical protein
MMEEAYSGKSIVDVYILGVVEEAAHFMDIMMSE